MTITELENAIQSGDNVYWASKKYEVVKENNQLVIRCTWNDKKTKVLREDKTTFNVNQKLFFISKS